MSTLQFTPSLNVVISVWRHSSIGHWQRRIGFCFVILMIIWSTVNKWWFTINFSLRCLLWLTYFGWFMCMNTRETGDTEKNTYIGSYQVRGSAWYDHSDSTLLACVSVNPASIVGSLGVTIDDTLSFNEHVYKICKSCNFHIQLLRQMHRHFSQTLQRPSPIQWSTVAWLLQLCVVLHVGFEHYSLAVGTNLVTCVITGPPYHTISCRSPLTASLVSNPVWAFSHNFHGADYTWAELSARSDSITSPNKYANWGLTDVACFMSMELSPHLRS